MANAKFLIGTMVQAAADDKVKGTVTKITPWYNPDGYKGHVYEFKDGNGGTFFGYKETDLQKAE